MKWVAGRGSEAKQSRECKWSTSLWNCRTEGCVVADLTYRDEVGWLAVLQLDSQPVEVLVAPSHAVLRQVELYPCCLNRNKYKHTFVVLPWRVLCLEYQMKTSFWSRNPSVIILCNCRPTGNTFFSSQVKSMCDVWTIIKKLKQNEHKEMNKKIYCAMFATFWAITFFAWRWQRQHVTCKLLIMPMLLLSMSVFGTSCVHV